MKSWYFFKLLNDTYELCKLRIDDESTLPILPVEEPNQTLPLKLTAKHVFNAACLLGADGERT